MKSIFWIGCILVVLVSLLASGAIAESVNTTTVEAAVAQAGNVTDVAKQAAEKVGTVAAQAENLTDAAKKVALASGIPEAENVTNAAKEVAAKVGAAAEKAENVTDVAKQALATVGAAAEKAGNVTNVTNVSNATTAQPAAEPDLVNDTLVKFVTDARTFARNNGKATALTTFNNPVGNFVKKNMYIFAYDYDGKALALPYNIGSIGTNQIALTDSTGLRYVQQMRDKAKSGKGAFVWYKDADMMNKGIVTKKVSYVTDVDGTYWIGGGVYISDEKKPAAPVVAKPTAVNTTASNATAVPVKN
jgi:hypothetical protein